MKWDNVALNYEQSIYSITKWESKLQRIINEIKDHSSILIIGCGSEIYLQSKILENFKNISIVCSDSSLEMIKFAQSKLNHENISYVQEDMLKFIYPKHFDYIISTNSVLMDSLQKNQIVFNNCYSSLKEGGKLIGYFPSFESCINLVHKNPELEPVFLLNNQTQLLTDSIDGTVQCFHSQSSLKTHLSNFKNHNLLKVSCSETEAEFDHLKSIYGAVLSDDLMKEVFEWFVIASK